MSTIKKNNNNLLLKKILSLKNIIFYIIINFQKIPKGIYILFFNDYQTLLDKYYSSQKRIQHDLTSNPRQPIFQRFLISIIYLISISIFFIISSLIKLLSSIFSKKISIKKSEAEIDGVSFIIPTWNKKDLILKCVELLDFHLNTEKTNIKKEIIIIENGSTDGSAEALSNLKTKIPIILLKQKSNIGFAKAINLGLINSKYNYVYLINNDMEPQKDFFNSIIDFAKILLKQNKIFFGISSQIFFFDQTKRREESGKTYMLPNLGYISVAHYIQDETLKKNSITLYPGGGSSLINKHYFKKIGGYDYKTYTPLYCEDLDAGFIAWKLGLPSYFDSNSHIIHHHRSSSKILISDPSYYMYKNWLVLILKNFDSIKNIISHLFLYSFQIISSDSHSKYSIEALKNIKYIFISKIKLYKYKTINSDKILINFPKFEHNFK